MKMNRRESREAAFLLVFEWSFHEYSLEEMQAQAAAARDLALDDFGRELAKRTVENHAHIDAIIEAQSENWKLSRISRVTLAALRLAFCEIEYFGDIPHGATINEAVELVKRYGDEAEAAYLNGILGGYVRREKPGETP